MPRYIGVDAHKRSLEVCILDAQGAVLERHQVPCGRETIETFCARHLEPADRLAIEATFHTWALVDRIAPAVASVTVSNPLRTKAIASAKIKTDKVDAEVLAQLLRCDFLPEVWVPDADTRRHRQLTHRRAALVQDRTAVKNRIHSTLAARLIAVPMARLFDARGLEWLRTLELDSDGRSFLDSDLRLLEAVEREIAQLEADIAPLAHRHQQVRLLMTLPGVDFVVALGLLAAWGDIRRFDDPDKAASALGLAPSTRQSGDHPGYHGPITEHGNVHARWLLVQAAQHLDKHPGPLGVFFRRLAARKNRNVAVVATARKLATIAWWMLTRNEPYRYAVPKTVDAKLLRLRIRATGQRLKSRVPKGTPRSPRYGSGQGVRRIPPLDEVLDQQQLPATTPVDRLPTGELRILQDTDSLDFARSLHHPLLLPKKPRRG